MVVGWQHKQIKFNSDLIYEVLKKYEWPIGCEGAFIPPWCWADDMKKILLDNFAPPL